MLTQALVQPQPLEPVIRHQVLGLTGSLEHHTRPCQLAHADVLPRDQLSFVQVRPVVEPLADQGIPVVYPIPDLDVQLLVMLIRSNVPRLEGIGVLFLRDETLGYPCRATRVYSQESFVSSSSSELDSDSCP